MNKGIVSIKISDTAVRELQLTEIETRQLSNEVLELLYMLIDRGHHDFRANGRDGELIFSTSGAGLYLPTMIPYTKGDPRPRGECSLEVHPARPGKEEFGEFLVVRDLLKYLIEDIEFSFDVYSDLQCVRHTLTDEAADRDEVTVHA